jgi:Zn-finger nucleic acid-binding protein
MQEVQRNGVTIDICPTCRGVWLDRGELEKLLGQVGQLERQYGREVDEPGQLRPRSVYETDDDEEYYRRTGKRKSKLGRIFDIFD